MLGRKPLRTQRHCSVCGVGKKPLLLLPSVADKNPETPPSPQESSTRAFPPLPSTCSSSISFSTPAELSAVPRKRADRHLLCISQLAAAGERCGGREEGVLPNTPRGEHQQAWRKGLKSGQATEEAHLCPRTDCSPSFPFTYSRCSYLFQMLFCF